MKGPNLNRSQPVANGRVVNTSGFMNDTAQPTCNRQLGFWVVGYGVFLGVIGLLGYASNPAAAKTALISGGTFGTLNVLFGLGLLRGIGVLRWVALAVAIVLSGIFVWRSSASWMAYADGEPKLLAALLISSMLAASLVIVFRLGRGRCCR